MKTSGEQKGVASSFENTALKASVGEEAGVEGMKLVKRTFVTDLEFLS